MTIFFSFFFLCSRFLFFIFLFVSLLFSFVCLPCLPVSVCLSGLSCMSVCLSLSVYLSVLSVCLLSFSFFLGHNSSFALSLPPLIMQSPFSLILYAPYFSPFLNFPPLLRHSSSSNAEAKKFSSSRRNFYNHRKVTAPEFHCTGSSQDHMFNSLQVYFTPGVLIILKSFLSCFHFFSSFFSFRPPVHHSTLEFKSLVIISQVSL